MRSIASRQDGDAAASGGECGWRDVEKADEAERLVIEEIRQMGNAALRSWAENQHKKKVEEFEKSKRGRRRRKKTLLAQRVW